MIKNSPALKLQNASAANTAAKNLELLVSVLVWQNAAHLKPHGKAYFLILRAEGSVGRNNGAVGCFN
ncbi:hypothetical protein ABF87_04325 [Nitrosomonas sp. JL21]|nr:hypothetical protein [Nitrosomonas sp. JL21]